MRRRPAPFILLLSLSLVFSAGMQPAHATGLISTERVVAASPAPEPEPAAQAASQRAALRQALEASGVESAHAQERVAALTDAEIAALIIRFEEAPKGGLWFTPFLVVAIVIGALIGARSRGTDSQATDLFGRQRNAAAVP